MTKTSKSDMYSQDVVLDVPVLDPVAAGVGAEQDNHAAVSMRSLSSWSSRSQRSYRGRWEPGPSGFP
jgi:hypothetical protein